MSVFVAVDQIDKVSFSLVVAPTLPSKELTQIKRENLSL